MKRKTQGAKAKPTRVPVTDPEATILKNKDGGFAPNYAPTVAVDTDSGIILDAQVPEGGAEASAVEPAVDRIEEVLGAPPERLLADGNFAEVKILKAFLHI